MNNSDLFVASSINNIQSISHNIDERKVLNLSFGAFAVRLRSFAQLNTLIGSTASVQCLRSMDYNWWSDDVFEQVTVCCLGALNEAPGKGEQL